MDKASSTGDPPDRRRDARLAGWALRVALGVIALLGSGDVAAAQTPPTPFDWDGLAANTWVRLSTTGAIPTKHFHPGMTVDADRDLLLLFGAESHEVASQYDNSVQRLDLKTLIWSRDYPPDPIATYTRTARGVLRTTSGRPWGDHAFDAVDYVPALRKMAVTQWPEHAFRFKRYLRGARATTWLYDPDTRLWEALSPGSPKLGNTVYDPDGRQLIGYDGRDTYMLDPRSLTWRRYRIAGGPTGYHLSLAYDPVLKRVLAFGDNRGSSDFYSLDVTRREWRKIDTPTRPPGSAGAAIVYSTKARALLLLAPAAGLNAYSNTQGTSETWAFDSREGEWRLLTRDSPPLFWMNYHRAYDAKRNVFLYGERRDAENAEGASLAIWAFRYVPGVNTNTTRSP